MFENKVVVVTGAAGALGQAVVSYFLNHGAKVACLDLNQALFDQAFGSALHENQLCIAVDLTDKTSIESANQQIVQHWSEPSILANIAGGFTMGEAVHETSDKTWNFLFELNAHSVVNASSVFVPSMIEKKFGKVINISAGAAHSGIANMGAYVASKSAVLRLTESMAQELRGQGINVNAILPGMIDTPRNRSDMPDADFSTWVPTQKIAEVIGFLASDAANQVHGAGLPVVGLS